MMSSNVLMDPLLRYTSYSRGIWMSQRTLCENSLWCTIQRASLSHSSGERP